MDRDELDIIIKAVFDGDQHMTLREIADEVYQRTGYQPSASVVKYSLERQGIYSDGRKARRWAYRHNGGHE